MSNKSSPDELLKMIAEMKAKILATRAKFMARFRIHLNEMSVIEMKVYLKDVSDEHLQSICDEFIPNEDYEICQAAQELITERKGNSN